MSSPALRILRSSSAALIILAGLLALSPGIGANRAFVGWKDAWRIGWGGVPTDEELLAKPDVDRDRDGRISDEERRWYVDAACAIAFDHRLARSLLAVIVGATLAMCGACFQVLFRNPLATPYTLGVAGGAALGAMVAITFGWHGLWMGVSTLTGSAFAGGMAVVGLIYLFARGSRRLSSNELMLAGVTLGLFCSALMLLLQFMSNERQTFAMIRWMMGSLDALTHARSISLLPFLVPAWLALILMAPALNLYRLGDDWATTRGVHVGRLQGACIVVCTLAVAAVVAHCGPIGFVGLVVPHLAALWVGSDCRILIPMSGLFGSIFLMICDWLAQTTMSAAAWATGRHVSGTILPIGVVTAVVGVPTFLVFLRRRTLRP